VKLVLTLISLVFLQNTWSQPMQPIIQRHGNFYNLQFKKFINDGGKLTDIVELRDIKNIQNLISDKGIPFSVNIKGLENRFNYVLTEQGILRVSRNPEGHAGKVSQSILTKGNAILAAGEVYFFRNHLEVAAYVTNHSRKFCTPYPHLKRVKIALQILGILSSKIILIDYPSRFCRQKK